MLASFGRSLGIRRIYVQALLNIFQVSTKEIMQPIPSVKDRHCFDADPDQNFQLMPKIPDLDPDPDRHQNNADSQADPSPSLTHDGKLGKISIFLTAMPLYNVLPFSSVAKGTVKCKK